jgi:hypothetical protein
MHRRKYFTTIHEGFTLLLSISRNVRIIKDKLSELIVYDWVVNVRKILLTAKLHLQSTVIQKLPGIQYPTTSDDNNHCVKLLANKFTYIMLRFVSYVFFTLLLS